MMSVKSLDISNGLDDSKFDILKSLLQYILTQVEEEDEYYVQLMCYAKKLNIFVDDLDDDAARSIGYDGTEHANYLYLYPTTDTIPEIEVKLLVTDSLEGFETVEAWADPFFPAPVWENKGAKAAAVAKTKPHKSGRSAPTRQLLN